jgi:hypothetical protein
VGYKKEDKERIANTLYCVLEWSDARKEHWFKLLGVFDDQVQAKRYMKDAYNIIFKNSGYSEFKDVRPIVSENEIKMEVGPYDYEEEWIII